MCTMIPTAKTSLLLALGRKKFILQFVTQTCHSVSALQNDMVSTKLKRTLLFTRMNNFTKNIENSLWDIRTNLPSNTTK